jgi:hypothetical protein
MKNRPSEHTNHIGQDYVQNINVRINGICHIIQCKFNIHDYPADGNVIKIIQK